MSAITDHYSAVTREIIMPGIRDNFFHGHPVLDALWKKRKHQNGGRLVDWSFYIDGNQNAQTYKAFEQFLVRPIGFAKRASLAWCHLVMPISLSKIEMVMNAKNSEAKVLDYVQDSITHAKRGFRDRLSQDLHGDGSSYSHPYWAEKTENPMIGLHKILTTGREYGGFNSSTYSQLDPYVIDLTDGSVTAPDFGDLITPGNEDYLPDRLSEAMNETNYGNGSVNFISGSIIMCEALEKCSAHKEIRVVNNGVADEGVNKVYYKGVEVLSDRDTYAGEMNLLNLDTIHLVTLDGLDMDFSPFEEFALRDDVSAALKVSLQLVCEEPRCNANITGGPDDRTITS